MVGDDDDNIVVDNYLKTTMMMTSKEEEKSDLVSINSVNLQSSQATSQQKSYTPNKKSISSSSSSSCSSSSTMTTSTALTATTTTTTTKKTNTNKSCNNNITNDPPESATGSNKTTTKFRTKLPCKMIDRSQISIWSILKQSIGKELSKIAMPAALCEPLSFLQRVTENFYYCDLFNKACDISLASNPCKRMEYIAAYAVSSISSNIDRLSKPFNPLLAETYELIRDDLGFKVVCEQVSHHPPVSAFCAESMGGSCNWRFYGSVNPKIKFWGKSIEVQPKGLLTLELNKFNEIYTWQTVTCCVHNIIVGKLWFEYYGTMEIACHQSGYKAIINFKPYSWSNKELHKFDGFIYDNNKKKIRALYGYWTHCVYSCDPQVYDEYIKSNKPLPMVKLDQYFNVIDDNQSNLKHVYSDSSIFNNSSSSQQQQTKQTPSFNLSNEDNNNTTNNTITHDEEIGGNKISLMNDEQSLSNDVQRKMNINHKTTLSEPAASFAGFPLSLPNAQHLDLCEVWRVVPRPTYAAEYYSFNYFTMTLNELKPEMEKLIAPTDSRFRKDVRRLELGDLDGASSEKTRLEEKQRESRKNRKDEYKGTWFKLGRHPVTGEENWQFTNKYWDRDYSGCMDLY